MLSQGYGLDAVCSGQLGIRHNVIAEMKAKCGFHGWSPNLANELPKEFLKLWIPCTSSHPQLNRSPLTEGPGVPGGARPSADGQGRAALRASGLDHGVGQGRWDNTLGLN